MPFRARERTTSPASSTSAARTTRCRAVTTRRRSRTAGLRAPFELINVYDVSAMYGGRIVRDKLWFYGVYRQVGGERTVPGMFHNKNAGNPNAWTVDFDRSQQAFNNSLERQATIRLTWQATPRNKFNFHWAEQYNDANYGPGAAPGCRPRRRKHRVACCTSRRVNPMPRGSRRSRAGCWPRPAGACIRPGTASGCATTDVQSGDDPAFGAGRRAGLCRQGRLHPWPDLADAARTGQGGFTHSLIGNLASLRASLTYVTGSHNMKFGYQGGFGNPSQTYQNFTQVVQVRTSNGVPNQLMQTISVGPDTKYIRNLIPTNFYAQDQWTLNRLTLQGGVRYDSLISNYPDQGIGGPGWPYAPVEIFFPSRSTPGYEWKDLTPRLGVAYDLFGNGKTAVKFNIGKYLEAITASNNDLDMNPLIRTATNSTRGWTDADRDFVPDCDLNNPGRTANAEDGQPDPGAAGVHPVLRPRLRRRLGQPCVQLVAGPVGSARSGATRFGDGRLHSQLVGQLVCRGQPGDNLADYTPFSIHAPLDPRLPDGGGYTISGLYNLVPAKVGQVDELAQSYKNFGEQTENWQGVDFSVVARLQNGLTVQGGTSTGRRLADGCAVRAKLPELGTGNRHGLATNSSVTANVNCPRGRRIRPLGEEPLLPHRGTLQNGLPRARIVHRPESGRAGVRDMGEHSRGLPAGGLHRDQCVDRGGAAAARPAADRGPTQVNLIAPATLWGERHNNVDMRIAKILRFGGMRSQVGVDIFNLLNADTVTNYNFGFVPGGSWLTPTTITPARYARISVQVDF